jgi:hypothetical protein
MEFSIIWRVDAAIWKIEGNKIIEIRNFLAASPCCRCLEAGEIVSIIIFYHKNVYDSKNYYIRVDLRLLTLTLLP